MQDQYKLDEHRRRVIEFLVQELHRRGRMSYRNLKALALKFAADQLGLDSYTASRVIKRSCIGSAFGVKSSQRNPNEAHMERYLGKRKKLAKLALVGRMRKDPTPSEKKLRDALVEFQRTHHGLKHQVLLYGYIPDFYSKDVRMVVEVDGSIHRLLPDRDKKRDADLAAFGIKTLRIPAERVMSDIEGVIAMIDEAVAHRRRELKESTKRKAS